MHWLFIWIDEEFVLRNWHFATMNCYRRHMAMHREKYRRNPGPTDLVNGVRAQGI
jgi:hypothetical protein